MARGLSREQSKEKNMKKQAGQNKGNQEGLTPAQRAERYVWNPLIVTISIISGLPLPSPCFEQPRALARTFLCPSLSLAQPPIFFFIFFF